MKPGQPLPVGHMLDGRYRINKVIGLGGMGRVYLSNDTRLANRPVAVKEMIVGEGLQERKAIEDFAREARVLAPLSHPGIPNLIDYFVEGGRHYLVMEYIAGGDLQHWLEELGPGGRAPEHRVVRWARQILDVLGFLHSQNPPIVYRDLKPANIMIDKSGRAMLIDFGIARFLPPGGRGTQIGSVGYAPPEQYLGKMEARSDLYSLAATMHHLLSGRDPQLEPPFSFPPLSQLAADVSPQTAELVMRTLDKDLTKRPSSAREMLHQLPDPGPDLDAGVLGPGASRPLAATPSDSALAKIKTVVLDRPARRFSRLVPPGQGALFKSAPPLAARRPKPGSAAVSSPSSTAKTQDLRKAPRSGSVRGPVPAPAAQPPRVKASPPRAPRPAGPSGRSAGASLNGASAGGAPASATGGRGASWAAKVPLVGIRAAAALGPRLVAKSEPLEFLLSGPRVVIGRAMDAADAIDLDLSSLRRGADRVSRRHAEIVRSGLDYFIRDLGSLNGTYIIGRGRLGRDQLYKLNDRDNVVLGGATFEFRKS